MKKYILSVTLLFFCSAFYVQAMTPKEIATKAFPSTVIITCKNQQDETISIGSGFFVGENTLISNVHVVYGCKSATAKIVNQNHELEIQGFTAIDLTNDLIVLKTSNTTTSFLNLAKLDQIEVGDEVFAIGNPQGLEGTFSQGIVSAKRMIDGREIIQTTAAISQGSSGGPILSKDGDVVGIAVAYIREGQNLNFAIPSFLAANLLNQQIEKRSLCFIPSSLPDRPKRDDLYNKKHIQLGYVTLYIGMPKNDALQKLKRYYDVRRLSPPGYLKSMSITTFQVLRVRNGLFEQIAIIQVKNGKIYGVQREISRSSHDSIVSVRQLYDLLSRITEQGDSICTIKTESNTSKCKFGTTSSKTIKIDFGDYELSLIVNDSTGEISTDIVLQDYLK